MNALLAAIALYAAPLGGHLQRIYDCHTHAHSTTCRVHVQGAPSSDYGMKSDGKVVPVGLDFGVRAKLVDGRWIVRGPFTS